MLKVIIWKEDLVGVAIIWQKLLQLITQFVQAEKTII